MDFNIVSTQNINFINFNKNEDDFIYLFEESVYELKPNTTYNYEIEFKYYNYEPVFINGTVTTLPNLQLWSNSTVIKEDLHKEQINFFDKSINYKVECRCKSVIRNEPVTNENELINSNDRYVLRWKDINVSHKVLIN
jgi:hypothetical protein